MTLTYAVIADGGIVLAADSQVTFTHRVPDLQGSRIAGTYEGTRSKIKRLGNHSAFSMAGNGGLIDTLLAKADLARLDHSKPFEQIVLDYQSVFREEWNTKYDQIGPRVEADFLFCGYIGGPSQRVPQIVKLESAAGFMYNPITGRGYAFTGAVEHGALMYLHHRFFREGMPIEQAKLLSYCMLAEVAEQDNTVGGQIEIEVITPNGSTPLTQVDEYEEIRQKTITNISEYLRTAAGPL